MRPVQDTSTDDGLRRNLAISTFLHVGFMAVLYFGMPSLFHPSDAVVHPLVPINIVDISEITNTRVKDDQQPEEQKAPPPAPESKPTPPPPTPAPTPPAPPKPPEPQQKEEVVPDALAPKPMQKPKPPEPPKEEHKPEPQNQLNSVLKNVAKLKPTDSTKSDSKPQDKTNPAPMNTNTAPNATGKSSSSNASALSDRLTISEEDALRRQISQCWNMPVGARDAQDLIVEVVIDVNADRTVREAHIANQLRYNTDTYFRAAADSALRALRNPKCSPLELNPDKYEQWKTIRFTFDPRDML